MTQGELAQYMAYKMNLDNIMGDYPMNEKERQEKAKHRRNEKEKKLNDPSYRIRSWCRSSTVHLSSEEIEHKMKEKLEEIIQERGKVYTMDDFIDDANTFDPVANFKKTCDKLLNKYVEKSKNDAKSDDNG